MDALSMAMVLLPLVWPSLIMGLLLHAVADLTRQDLFFGVTVDPAFRQSDTARTTRRQYAIAIWVGTLITIGVTTLAAFAAISAFSGSEPHAPAAVSVGLRALPVILQPAVALWAFLRARRATLPHAVPRATMIRIELSARPEATRAPLVALAAPIASLAALAIWTVLRWDDLPPRLAVHWALEGPDRWIATTPASVTTLLGIHALVCLLLALLALGVIYGSRRIATSGEAAEREQRFRKRIVLLLIAAQYFTVFPVWAELLVLPAAAMKFWALAFAATLLVLLARLVLAGQGGARGLARSGSAVGDRTDDRHWRWGLLYFNRADPAFLVEKRFGVGYTFNFAHPYAWAVLALIVAIPLLARLL